MADRLKALDIWYHMPPGSFLWQEEAKQLQRTLDHCSGEVLLQLGGRSTFDWFQNDNFKYKLRMVTTPGSSECDQVVVDLDSAWPILPNVTDVLLLPHVLESVDDPEAIIAQAYESLPTGGKLVVLAFNSISLWGVKKLFKGGRGFPWELRFFTPWRLHRLITDAGFEVVHRSSSYFRPAFSHGSLANSLKILDTVGSWLYPLCGASMILVAEKSGVAPIVQGKKNKRWFKAPAITS